MCNREMWSATQLFCDICGCTCLLIQANVQQPNSFNLSKHLERKIAQLVLGYMSQSVHIVPAAEAVRNTELDNASSKSAAIRI